MLSASDMQHAMHVFSWTGELHSRCHCSSRYVSPCTCGLSRADQLLSTCHRRKRPLNHIWYKKSRKSNESRQPLESNVIRLKADVSPGRVFEATSARAHAAHS
jgi:hypothetical protein